MNSLFVIIGAVIALAIEFIVNKKNRQVGWKDSLLAEFKEFSFSNISSWVTTVLGGASLAIWHNDLDVVWYQAMLSGMLFEFGLSSSVEKVVESFEVKETQNTI